MCIFEHTRALQLVLLLISILLAYSVNTHSNKEKKKIKNYANKCLQIKKLKKNCGYEAKDKQLNEILIYIK